jgi:hypothetical protein
MLPSGEDQQHECMWPSARTSNSADLKRFRTMGRRVHKLDAHVPFPASLDLSPFCDEATLAVFNSRDQMYFIAEIRCT